MEIQAFAAWAEDYLASKTASAPRGAALAWQRRETLRKLIETDPERALAFAVPYRWRTQLPAEVTRHFETRVDARGDLAIALGENSSGRPTVYAQATIRGTNYRAFVYGRRVAQPCLTNIPLHGILLDGKLALSHDPMRVLSADESHALNDFSNATANHACRVCAKESAAVASAIVAGLGGESAVFCGQEHYQMVHDYWIASEAELARRKLAGDTSGNSWTHGEKSLLYIRVNFPDDLTEPISAESANANLAQVNAFYVKNSYNSTSLRWTVTPLLMLPYPKAWYGTNNADVFALLTDAREAAKAAGYDTANYDLDIVCLPSVPTYSWGGLGMVGGKGTWLQSTGVSVTAHELGHNFGLLHANFWNPLTNTISTGFGTNVEYGNVFDVMGGSSGGDFSAVFKNSLAWLPDASVQHITTSAVERLYPFDLPTRESGRAYAFRLQKDFQREYWVEFRADPATSTPWLESGVLLNWGAWVESGGDSHLLDSTPGSQRGVQDAPLLIGQTFSDVANGIHITPLSRGDAVDESAMLVQFHVGSFERNQPPELDVQIDRTNAALGELVSFHVNAWDPENDTLAFSWTFDDGTFSTNNLPWISKRYTGPGHHVVRCTVSDMKGGTRSLNSVVTVGKPPGFYLSGQVLGPDGYPIEGVRIDLNATTPPRTPGNFTDTHGRYFIAGLEGQQELTAVKYGYVLTNAGWENPLNVESNTVLVNFVATPMQSLTVAVQTNQIAESGKVTNWFLITRTGDASTNLVFSLNLSGTAKDDVDFRLEPPLSRGSNSLEFLPGSNTLAIAVTALNDSLGEGPESVTMTLYEDPAYALQTFAEATLTILDDDSLVPPTISIAAEVPQVSEGDPGNARFVITRHGGTNADVAVYYSVDGSATVGSDYGALAGVALIPAGRASATIDLRLIDDKEIEAKETVQVVLLPRPAHTITGTSARVVIADDDESAVSVHATRDASERSGSGSFTVSRSGDLTGNLTVFYAVSGSASNGTDYEILSGVLTIPAGFPSADIVVTPRSDSVVEGDEMVVVTLAGAAHYDIDSPGSATLLLHDAQKGDVSVIATDRQASEHGDDFGEFEIVRGSPGTGRLAVDLAISGTAIRGADYAPLETSVTIPEGASSTKLLVVAFDDLHCEPTEDIIVTILPSTNYNLGSEPSARVQILDDDEGSVPAVGFASASSSAPEGQARSIIVSLSRTSAEPATVSLKVVGGTARASDYTLESTSMTFEAGETAKPLPVRIKSNTTFEPDRTIRIALFDPVGATLDGIKIHTHTIVDDDAATLSVVATGSSISESSGAPGSFRITRVGRTNDPVTVNIELSGTASAPSDYASISPTITIPAGATSIDLPIQVHNDDAVELDEEVTLRLVSASGSVLGSASTASIVIVDDDLDPSLIVAVSSTNAPYAVEGGTAGAFTLSRGSGTGALEVEYALSGTALNGTDYAAIPGITTFADGQLSVVVPVTPTDDALVEGEETVTLAITSVGGYRLANPAAATVILQDNDQRVGITASDFTATEPGATDPATVTFTRFGTTNSSLQVFFTTSGTASNGTDYVFLTNSFTIPAGSLSADMTLIPLDDGLVEGIETVLVSLSPRSTYKLDTATNATVYLVDDEPMLTITAHVARVKEGSQDPGILRIHRAGNPDYEFTARIAITGSARPFADYAPLMTNVFFPCGAIAVDLEVFPFNEFAVEGDETVSGALLPSPEYSILSPSNAAVVIADVGVNRAPVVQITCPTVGLVNLLGTNANLILDSVVTDDGVPGPVKVTWTKESGPDSYFFGDTNMPSTTVSFTNAGAYTLRVTADDGELQSYARVMVILGAAELLETRRSLHWSFDESFGTTAFDSAGTNNGLLIGDPAWTTDGAFAGALDFPGNGDHVRTEHATNLLSGMRELTVALWLKPSIESQNSALLCSEDSGAGTTLTLASKATGGCGGRPNVFEAVIPSSRGIVRRTSAANVLSNDWQHVSLVWSNGLAPSLYINGLLDQPQYQMAPLTGVITNCPGLIVGKGPKGFLSSWAGQLDEISVYPRALSSGELLAIGGACQEANFGPLVDAGPDSTLQINMPVALEGWVSDDGKPVPPGVLTLVWTNVSGPADVVIGDSTSLKTEAQFTVAGDYVMRLMAFDGEVKTYDDVALKMIEPTRIDVYASDPDAAEFGPDPGQFTFSRDGDLDVELEIAFSIGGITTNGVDYIKLPSSVLFTNGAQTVELVVTPFLDHRTEGDQNVTVTVVSNRAYSIGSAEATVVLHDSPFGAWCVDHFTLEELTNPKLSAEDGDFDEDGLLNFIEYALNQDPRRAPTNSAVTIAVETNSVTGKQHLTVNYKRRLQPTDAVYAPSVSSDLLTWNTGSAFFEETTTSDENGVTETVKSRLLEPYPPKANTYVALRMWLQVTTP